MTNISLAMPFHPPFVVAVHILLGSATHLRRLCIDRLHVVVLVSVGLSVVY